MQYRTWVDLFRDDYVNSVKIDKVKISARIVAMVFHSGGRFVLLDEGKEKWLPISDRKALEKTSQALREMPRGPQSTDKFKAPVDSSQHFTRRFLKLYNCKAVLKRAQELLGIRSSTSHLKIQPTEPFQYLPTLNSDGVFVFVSSIGGNSSSKHKNRKSKSELSSIHGNHQSDNSNNQKKTKTSKKRQRSKDRWEEEDDDDDHDDEEEEEEEEDESMNDDSDPVIRSLVRKKQSRSRTGRSLRAAPKHRSDPSAAHRRRRLTKTLGNRPIRVETLELDDFAASSSSSDDENEIVHDLLLPRPASQTTIRRTLIRLDDKKLLTQPLYDRWHDDGHHPVLLRLLLRGVKKNVKGDDIDNDDQEEDFDPSIPLYGAAHDTDEWVALGLMDPPLESGILVKHKSSNVDEEEDDDDDDDDEDNLPLTQLVSQKRTKRFFGPGQPVVFGGALPPRASTPHFVPPNHTC